MLRHAAVQIGLIASGLLASGLLATGAQADIWKWVDAQGRVQYSDRWTPGAVLIKGDHPRESDASSPPSAPDEQAQQDASNRKIDAELDREAAQRAVEKDQAAARDARCKQAKDQYQKLIESRRVYREDKNGDRTYLSDDEADKARVQARLDMESACGQSASPNAS